MIQMEATRNPTSANFTSTCERNLVMSLRKPQFTVTKSGDEFRDTADSHHLCSAPPGLGYLVQAECACFFPEVDYFSCISVSRSPTNHHTFFKKIPVRLELTFAFFMFIH